MREEILAFGEDFGKEKNFFAFAKGEAESYFVCGYITIDFKRLPPVFENVRILCWMRMPLVTGRISLLI